ncbi:serine hydroxymethyltransferase [Gordonia effusa NBRC 100432]|uniref:Probable serine hydroxymethyltransferase n=1 Tax=Gordonia effusa NBRC 100432 TaxID=1077974 RepID=H0QVP7_9ACTN|nr:serine hydroxymethyltransferase [Gordonia effusa]GAB16898.1 serine hydroxymethyltransferase [Gordonia effusa NBRC 100432]
MTFSAVSSSLADADPEVAALIESESTRRRSTLQLVASESVASPAVRAALASDLGDKYAEGYPGARYHGGCGVVDEVENLAISRARGLFGADYANVQAISGSAAGQAVYAAFAQPGDPVLALRLMHGGHQTHGSRANFSGRWFSPITYRVREDDELIDYDQLRDTALVHRPGIIVAGSSSYSRHIDWAALRSIADEADAILWCDAAHLAGLVAGGAAPSPVPFADVVTVSTQKVFWGPRGGAILAREEHAPALQKAVFPFLQGGPAMNSIAAKAITFAEAATPKFAEYARAVVRNAQELSIALAERGLRTVSAGTDTHLAVIDVTSSGLTGRAAAAALADAGIVVDKAVLPYDTAPVADGSAIRLGTAVLTTQGFAAPEMTTVADWIARALTDEGARAEIKDQIEQRCGN